MLWEAPKIHLVFQNWQSLSLILVLLVGFIVWISYVARSISFIKKRLPSLVTKEEAKKMLDDFKKELADHAQ